MARKRFGQHFLHDPRVIASIVDAIDPRPGERLVEIGPGRGALTLPLLERAGSLDAIELDRDLAPVLTAACADAGDLRLHQADALRFDYAALGAGAPLRLVGNLPYNISSPLLFALLQSAAVIKDMHFMLQREVVERMVAGCGGAAYGRLSVALAARADAVLLLRVGRGAFTPPPQVESAVVRLLPRPPPFEIRSWPAFDKLLAQAFSARRKTLKNALAPLLGPAAIAAAGVDATLRPEQIAPADFAALANAFADTQANGAPAA